MLKECTKCSKRRQLMKFFKDKTKSDGLDSWCMYCRNRYKRLNRFKILKRRNKTARVDQLKCLYGMSQKDYDFLYKKQKGKCGICRQHSSSFTRILCVDHSHRTGLVRGLLCFKCNAALGGFKDNRKLLNNAIQWLEKKCPL